MSQAAEPEQESDEDDWFNKTEEDFVVHIPNPAAAATTFETVYDDGEEERTSVREMLDDLKLGINDIDGNYTDSLKSSGSGHAAKCNISKGVPEKYIQTIPFAKLANIVENETFSMFADIYVQKEEFLATLRKKTYGEELMFVLLRIMNKLDTFPLYEVVKQFTSVLLGQGHFFEQLLKFFQHNAEGEKKKKKKSKIIRPTIAKADMMDALLKFLTHAKGQLPLSNDVTCFSDTLAEVLPEKDKIQRELLKQLKGATLDEHSTRKISIYPTIRELKDGAGPSLDLKRNIVRGKYENVEHYLDVHLNLLKEDFLIPLRSGLEKYRKHVAKHARQLQFVGENIRVHYPVQLLLPTTVNRRTVKEQLILVDLDAGMRGHSNVSARYRRLSLPNTKRLLTGSMVLFSSGPELNDLIVAVISSRDTNQLLNGYINVELIRLEQDGETNVGSCGMNIFNRPLLMIESDIFFEPYHQTFHALGRLAEENFPFKSYIVEAAKSVKQLPRYLLDGEKQLFKYSDIEFDLKKTENWPTAALKAAVGLNESQFHAYQMALTSRFSLIHGPPGTGKTLVGLKIVETLLANTSEQILIICLTNHALDLFLCGVKRYTKSIVRMGGQSKHPLLDAFNVKQLHEDEQIDRRLRICYYNSKQEYLKLVEQFDELQQQQEGSAGLSDAMANCMDKLYNASRRHNELSQLSTLKLIQNFRIVAMTTTFAARNRTLLELLRTPIIVIEEAAEILEAHILSSLTQYTEQCVLIGDHKQLRPTTSTFILSRFYRMDLSLFERMINNHFSVATMTVQHRMLPAIANLLRPAIYPLLDDAESVKSYPSVVGMKHSVFFLRHTSPEGGGNAGQTTAKDGNDEDDEAGDEKSKRNSFECEFLLALCEYLLAQGPYTTQDIVILTAYNGQMLQFVSERKNRPALQGVRVAVIDNYQGEESKIILLSLVRSENSSSDCNSDTIGFLSHDNRICVTLSRAREGLYIVGNMNLLARCSKTWANVERQLLDQEAIDDSLPLQCVIHGQDVKVKRPEDFKQLLLDNRTCICGVY